NKALKKTSIKEAQQHESKGLKKDTLDDGAITVRVGKEELKMTNNENISIPVFSGTKRHERKNPDQFRKYRRQKSVDVRYVCGVNNKTRTIVVNNEVTVAEYNKNRLAFNQRKVTKNQNNNISKEAFNNACRSWISRVNSLRNVMSVKEQEKHMFDVSSCHTIDEFLGDNVKSKLYDKEGRIISRKVHTKRRVSESKIMELLWHKKKGGSQYAILP
ncbi:184_t:CDS:2, partial [Gigaspora rosea]